MEGEKTEGGQDVCHDSCTGSFNGTIRDDCMQMSRDITKIACLLKGIYQPLHGCTAIDTSKRPRQNPRVNQ